MENFGGMDGVVEGGDNGLRKMGASVEAVNR